MNSRTDLAVEWKESSGDLEGIISFEKTVQDATLTDIKIVTLSAEERLGRRRGRYVTVSMPPFSNTSEYSKSAADMVTNALSSMLPKGDGPILVAGLGNESITPDALGPMTAKNVLVTRHLGGNLLRDLGLNGIKSVAVITTGVLGNTGVESAELIKSVAKSLRPRAIIAIDALAAKGIGRLGCTVQLSNAGICPGSGVSNSRAEISENTLKIPVLALGVPLVVDAATLVYDLAGVRVNNCDAIVTGREIDLTVRRAARFLGICLNRALQPDLTEEDILLLLEA